MNKLTKANIEQLAKEIMVFLEKEEMMSGVSIYYNGKVVRAKTEYNDFTDTFSYSWETTENVDPHNYFDYAAYDHILSMSFEGALYDVLNYSGGRKDAEFCDIFERYGVYYEFGNAWNLSVYPNDDDMEVEYTKYKRPKETIRLYRYNRMDNPSALQAIMDVWYELSKNEGDKGSCVLGAGFSFEWQDNEYFMSACSPYQGSLSWEVHKDTVKGLLEDIGATEIYYDWGRMD